MDLDEAMASIEQLVLNATRRFGRHADDAAQDLRLRLIVAYQQSFDPSLSKWSTYAYQRIPGMVVDYLRGQFGRTGDRLRLVNDGVQTDGAHDAASFDDIAIVDCCDVLEVMERSRRLRPVALYARGHTMKQVGELMGYHADHISKLISRSVRENGDRILELMGAGR